MLNKDLIKKRFEKSLLTYPKYAYIQQETSEKLAGFVDKKYGSILEIGSYSGFLTKEIVKKTEFGTYLAVDIVDSFSCIKNLSPKIRFLKGDLEKVELSQKYDLIISSSTLQWCSDFNKTIKKLRSYLTPEGHLIISIFGKKNLYQIKEAFETSLNYPDIKDIEHLFSKNAKIFEEDKTLQFSSAIDILKHLKYTGVNSLKNEFSYCKIKQALNILENKYQNKLTYNPLYVID